MMEETGRHKDAFEQYYALGDNRSIKKLHQHCTKLALKHVPSLRTLKNWSSWFNWQEKIRIRDTEIARGVSEKVTKSSIDARAKALNDIQTLTGLTWVAIETAFPKDKKTGKRITTLQVETPRDLKGLVDSILRAEEVKLKITGEPDKVEHSGEVTVKNVEVSDKIAKKVLDEVAKEGFTEQDNGTASVTD